MFKILCIWLFLKSVWIFFSICQELMHRGKAKFPGVRCARRRPCISGLSSLNCVLEGSSPLADTLLSDKEAPRLHYDQTGFWGLWNVDGKNRSRKIYLFKFARGGNLFTFLDRLSRCQSKAKAMENELFESLSLQGRTCWPNRPLSQGREL